MKKLIDETAGRIVEWHRQWPKSVVMWSGGKDSTAMLHLMLEVAGVKPPVIQLREHRFRERYAYSDALIAKWGLEVYDYPPSKLELGSGPDVETGEMRFDLLKHYQWGSKLVSLCLGTERPTDGKPYLCAVDDYLNRPTGTFNWPWPAAYIGTKNTDTDLIKGQVHLNQHVRIVAGAPVSLYPLRDWTDADVFNYLVQSGVQPDPTRYVEANGVWRNNPDKSLNADFYPVCVNCVDRHQGPTVYCPKLKGKITNISASVPYNDIVIDDLGFRPTWQDADGKILAVAQHATD